MADPGPVPTHSAGSAKPPPKAEPRRQPPRYGRPPAKLDDGFFKGFTGISFDALRLDTAASLFGSDMSLDNLAFSPPAAAGVPELDGVSLLTPLI